MGGEREKTKKEDINLSRSREKKGGGERGDFPSCRKERKEVHRRPEGKKNVIFIERREKKRKEDA